jgi:hypothetical protein
LIERGLKHPQRYEKHLISAALKVPEEELFPCDLRKSRQIINTELEDFRP